MATFLETTRSGRRAILGALGGLSLAARGRGARGQTHRRLIRFAFFGTPSELRAYQGLRAAFEVAHPDIEVEMMALDSGDAALRPDTLQRNPNRPWLQRGGFYQPWLWSSLSSTRAPDVFMLGYQRFPSYTARGVIAPLDPYLAASTVLRADDFYPAPLDAFRATDLANGGHCCPSSARSTAPFSRRSMSMRMCGRRPRRSPVAFTASSATG
ncbi:MAG: hypothetical protein U0031_03185 [Thermomicrobiales bacterium]